MQEMPVGRPLYYKRESNGHFKRKLVAGYDGWSYQCLDWLNYMQYSPELKKGSNDYHTIISAVHGEHTVTHDGKNYTVDGYCKTPTGLMLYEYLGCR